MRNPFRHSHGFLVGIYLGFFSDGYLPPARRYDGWGARYLPPTCGSDSQKVWAHSLFHHRQKALISLPSTFSSQIIILTKITTTGTILIKRDQPS